MRNSISIFPPVLIPPLSAGYHSAGANWSFPIKKQLAADNDAGNWLAIDRRRLAEDFGDFLRGTTNSAGALFENGEPANSSVKEGHHEFQN